MAQALIVFLLLGLAHCFETTRNETGTASTACGSVSPEIQSFSEPELEKPGEPHLPHALHGPIEGRKKRGHEGLFSGASWRLCLQ